MNVFWKVNFFLVKSNAFRTHRPTSIPLYILIRGLSIILYLSGVATFSFPYPLETVSETRKIHTRNMHIILYWLGRCKLYNNGLRLYTDISYRFNSDSNYLFNQPFGRRRNNNNNKKIRDYTGSIFTRYVDNTLYSCFSIL